MKLPEEFIIRIQNQKYIDSTALLNALRKNSPVSIRINKVKWDKKPSDSQPVPWCTAGFYLAKRPSYTFDPLYHAGCYYPQEASGMFIEHVFKKLFGGLKKLKVLDLCGAPGGKSTHLSSLIGTEGLLVANDVIRARALILSGNIARWGTSNTIVTQSDPSDFRLLEGFFDIILVDAPCSGEGMFRDPVAVREWSVENTMMCSERQKRILSDVWPALKENGILVYSTCTFNPDENEQNIRWLIDRKKAEPVKIDTTDYKGITEIDYQGIFGYGFYPYKVEGEGLFISVIRKCEKSTDKLIYSNKKIDINHSNNEYMSIKKLININKDSLLKINGSFYKVPGTLKEYFLLSKYLKIISPGTTIGKVGKKDFLPSHELALSEDIKKDAFPSIDLDYDQAVGFLKKESIRLSVRDTGWFLVTYRGVYLGFVKNIGNRINNYYPVEWRIRMIIGAREQERLIVWE